jgi:hypothetical protein
MVKIYGVFSEMLNVYENILMKAYEYPSSIEVVELRSRTKQITDKIKLMQMDLINRPIQSEHVSDEIVGQFSDILKNLKEADNENNPIIISNTIIQVEGLMSAGVDRFFISGATPLRFRCEEGHPFSAPPPKKCPVDGTKISPVKDND